MTRPDQQHDRVPDGRQWRLRGTGECVAGPPGKELSQTPRGGDGGGGGLAVVEDVPVGRQLLSVPQYFTEHFQPLPRPLGLGRPLPFPLLHGTPLQNLL